MPRKASPTKLVPTSMRFTAEMKARIQALADADSRSLSNWLETRIARVVEQEEAAAKGKRK